MDIIKLSIGAGEGILLVAERKEVLAMTTIAGQGSGSATSTPVRVPVAAQIKNSTDWQSFFIWCG